MTALPVEALERWRRTERALELLPPDAPARGDAEALLVRMRALYQHLTERAELSEAMLERASVEFQRADALLRALEARALAERAERAERTDAAERAERADWLERADAAES